MESEAGLNNSDTKPDNLRFVPTQPEYEDMTSIDLIRIALNNNVHSAIFEAVRHGKYKSGIRYNMDGTSYVLQEKPKARLPPVPWYELNFYLPRSETNPLPTSVVNTDEEFDWKVDTGRIGTLPRFQDYLVENPYERFLVPPARDARESPSADPFVDAPSQVQAGSMTHLREQRGHTNEALAAVTRNPILETPSQAQANSMVHLPRQPTKTTPAPASTTREPRSTQRRKIEEDLDESYSSSPTPNNSDDEDYAPTPRKRQKASPGARSLRRKQGRKQGYQLW